MIQKTNAEKAEIKAAKQAYKQRNKYEQFQRDEVRKDLQEYKKRKAEMILTGIVDGEEVLPDDYPVIWDYLYVVDDNGGKVFKSDIKGTVIELKYNLRRKGYQAINIYTCNTVKRNIR
jgi:hypothetical protein